MARQRHAITPCGTSSTQHWIHLVEDEQVDAEAGKEKETVAGERGEEMLNKRLCSYQLHFVPLLLFIVVL